MKTQGPPEGASRGLRQLVAEFTGTPEHEIEALVLPDGTGWALHTRIAEGYIKSADVRVGYVKR